VIFFLKQKLKTQGKHFYLELIDLNEFCIVQTAIINKGSVRWSMECYFMYYSTQWDGQYQTSQSMLYREITAVYSEIHIKPINTLCGQNRGFLYVKHSGANTGFKGLIP